MTVKAFVDPGSVFLTVPEHIALQLGFDTSEVAQRENKGVRPLIFLPYIPYIYLIH